VIDQQAEAIGIDRQEGARPCKPDAAWEALEQFIHTIQEGRQAPGQYRAALSAVCEATGAQIAYLYSDRLSRVLEIAGNTKPAAQWCCDFCHKLAAAMPAGGVWEEAPSTAPNGASPNGQPHEPAPVAAALVAVETPRPAWLVAVSFDRARQLDARDLQVVRVIWQLQVGQDRHATVYDKLKETLFGVVRCLSTAIDAKDPYTCGHSERVARIAVRLGEELKLPRGEVSDLYLAGLLHDVGKIGIRDDVLFKEGSLTPEEYAHIKEHPIWGDRIVSNVTRLAYLRPGVRGHHERFDGKGYPDALAGESIPKMARILAVADACDAMMSTRRYRAAIPPERIEEIMREGSGTQWDPWVIDAFFACRKDLYAVCQRGLGQSVYIAVERAAVDAGSKNMVGRTFLKHG
jgi:HD-GYP domain-containing protein (c-di-GMP phosphodiesterase class II)